MADAGQNDHNWPPGGFTINTLEVQQSGPGPVWCAAATVSTSAAVARLVGLNTAAVLVGEVDRCVAPHHPLTLTASLQGHISEILVLSRPYQCLDRFNLGIKVPWVSAVPLLSGESVGHHMV